ncbi:MAG: SRPBCC domain-containing protein [Actinomycetota bacterium]|nr:SRPBCC domain-containing protein [Actinomycetota bacterium]
MEVTREMVLDAPLDEVWEALIEPGRVDEWFTEDGAERELAIEEVEAGRRVAYTWDEGNVVIELEEVDAGTRVVVTETGEPGWNAVFALRALAYAYA